MNEKAAIEKASFKMPYNNTEIWFEHLDGIKNNKKAILEKLSTDKYTFNRPSYPSAVAVNIAESLIDCEIILALRNAFSEEKCFQRVCFVGTAFFTRQKIKRAFNNAPFKIAFINDFEKAKEWLTKY